MHQIYIEYSFQISPKEPATEILIAELGNLGFESFVETNNGLLAYIIKDDWQPNILANIFVLQSNEFQVSFSHKEIEQTNWNKEWEKNFNPIYIDDKVAVRAPFHENPNLEFDIIIEPKMSFGTGHHETTHMMIQLLLTMDVTNQKVLDMGCGTGVLAIFAAQKNATFIDAIDIDEWCYKNTLENIERNNCNHINVYLGDASLLQNQKYNTIVANINRNILLQDLPSYEACLATKGNLLLSGFYKEDLPLIDAKAKQLHLKRTQTLNKNNWLAVKYEKN